VLDPAEGQPGIGKANVQSSASVTVVPRGSELTQQQVDAIAQLVAGSHAGLKPQNVAVIDARTNVRCRRAPKTFVKPEIHGGQAGGEKHVRETIETALATHSRASVWP
jgi:flagellar biosynthesis/type III secretory pathway M-ring protein FliF/YscJ